MTKMKILCLPGWGTGLSSLFTQVAMIRMEEFEQELNAIAKRNAGIKTFNLCIRVECKILIVKEFDFNFTS